MKDTNFYNTESAVYSAKRYPKLATTFTQFFFKERLRVTLTLLQKYMQGKGSISLLEIGCADGVVARAIWQRFGVKLSPFEAIDLSPKMIEVAKCSNTDTPITFEVRSGVALLKNYNCIIEIGVLNYLTLEEELASVRSALLPKGVYVCSISGKSSLQTSLKGEEGFMHLLSYKQYEEKFNKMFTIITAVPVGLFVPWLWKVPALARLVQPIVDISILWIAPNSAHEKIYVLTLK